MTAWGRFEGRDLDPFPREPYPWRRVVALLNVWNDRPELEHTLETWYPHVDHVIAADGAYAGIPRAEDRGLSTDGTRQLLGQLGNCTLLNAPNLPQVEKRSLLLGAEMLREGDLVWVIDADERYENAGAIREAPELDVGWIRYTAPIYQRAQDIPRIFRWRPGLHYRVRHHWLYDDRGRLVKTNQRGGAGLAHRLLPIVFHNSRGKRRPRRRAQLAQRHRGAQARNELRRSRGAPVQGREPLRILNLAPIDPGAAVNRFHAALNTTTPHESIYGVWRTDKLQAPTQHVGGGAKKLLQEASETADVVHIHRDPRFAGKWGISRTTGRGRAIVLHHHGTPYRSKPGYYNRQPADLRLVSNLELLQYGPELHYLPNPVPVGIYRQLARERPAWTERPFRVGHSPTWRGRKGTEAFLRVVKRLQESAVEIEPVLIENVPLRRSLELKATCHAFFDSFWLGLQCSGLEAAAMGLPVIAGDEDVRRGYQKWLGSVPYTFAADEDELETRLFELLMLPHHYLREASRVSRYVLEHHDYPAVATRYLELLDDAVGWKSKFMISRFRGGLSA